MSEVRSLRPGVFSSYTVSSAGGAARAVQYAAVCACAEKGTAGQLSHFTRYSDAAALLGGGALLEAVRALLESGVGEVLAVPVSTGGTAPTLALYQAAFAAVQGAENVGVLLCDSGELAVQQALLASVNAASAALRERVGVVFGADVTTAAANAKALNSERMALCYPAGFAGACALAGLLLTTAVGENLSGSSCPRLALPEQNLPEEQVQTLLAAGVTVLERIGGNAECIKAMSTRTTTGGVADSTFWNIATIRVIDHILQRARATLKPVLKTARGSAATLQTVVAQMTVLLAAAVEENLVNSFETPRAALAAGDASTCVVELSFAVANAINQIHLVAHIAL